MAKRYSAQQTASLLERFVVPNRLDRIEQVLDQRTKHLTVVLDNVKNYHNVSAVLRSADAFGVAEVQLVGDAFEVSRGISLGTERWMQLRQHEQAKNAVQWLKEEGFAITILQPEDHQRTSEKVPSLSVTELPFEKKLALVFGNEHSGVQKEFQDAADYHAFIPMCGFVESFNISVACAITLFCSSIGATKPERRCSPLDEGERDQLRANWLKASVRNSDAILREIEARDDGDEEST